MIKAREVVLNSSNFGFKINQEGMIQISLGPAHVSMSLDSIYDLQYELAAFLAQVELEEYPREREDEISGIMEGRNVLEALAHYPKAK